MIPRILLLLTALFFPLLARAGDPPRKGPAAGEAMLKGLKARSIGPAIMGGRVSDIAIDPKNPFTFYVGFATSGVWKTGNNGVSFEPIFDDEPVQSIGAVAVS